MAQNKSGRRLAVADEVTQTEGYENSQRKRKLIERGFGSATSSCPIRRVMVHSIKTVNQLFLLTMAAHNSVLTRTLAEVQPSTA